MYQINNRRFLCSLPFMLCALSYQVSAQNRDQTFEKADYFYTNNNVYLYSEPEPRSAERLAVVPFNAKVISKKQMTTTLNGNPLLWHQIKWRKKIGWILGKNLGKTKQPVAHAELFQSAGLETDLSGLLEFKVDKEKALAMAKDELQKFKGSAEFPDYDEVLSRIDFSKPFISAVINEDQQKTKRQAIIILFDHYFESNQFAHVIFLKTTDGYSCFGRGFHLGSKKAFINEVKNDQTYFTD